MSDADMQRPGLDEAWPRCLGRSFTFSAPPARPAGSEAVRTPARRDQTLRQRRRRRSPDWNRATPAAAWCFTGHATRASACACTGQRRAGESEDPIAPVALWRTRPLPVHADNHRQLSSCLGAQPDPSPEGGRALPQIWAPERRPARGRPDFNNWTGRDLNPRRHVGDLNCSSALGRANVTQITVTELMKLLLKTRPWLTCETPGPSKDRRAVAPRLTVLQDKPGARASELL